MAGDWRSYSNDDQGGHMKVQLLVLGSLLTLLAGCSSAGEPKDPASQQTQLATSYSKRVHDGLAGGGAADA